MKKQIPVWECPRCSYVMRPTTAQEIREEEGLLAEFQRAGQAIAEGERDPEPGEIAQCFRCGKFAVIGEDLQLRMPTPDEQLAINTNAHLTESLIVWASYVGAHRNEQTTTSNGLLLTDESDATARNGRGSLGSARALACWR